METGIVAKDVCVISKNQSMTLRPLEIFNTLSAKYHSNDGKVLTDEIFLLKNLDLVSLHCIFVGNKTRHASHSNSAPGRVFDFYGGALS